MLNFCPHKDKKESDAKENVHITFLSFSEYREKKLVQREDMMTSPSLHSLTMEAIGSQLQPSNMKMIVLGELLNNGFQSKDKKVRSDLVQKKKRWSKKVKKAEKLGVPGII
ncbi:hypothetical protein L1987_64697 [Smallanthus sonchifolius]|uniref:Uncharacterized protein n=1 Tax=Smallanthus sonchifolius TaxID=185202 RepID=A0ACB9BSN2_9ASTR|nr:hypothetical protein L1987_64697 [Smallanthus sonchifolius]